MDICDQLDNWDHLTSDKKFDEVKSWLEDKASDWNLNDVKVERGIPTDSDGNEHWASYNPENNTITLHPDLFGHDFSGSDTYNSAAHELGHALNDSVYEDLADSDEDDDPADGADMGGDEFDTAMREDYAQDFAEAYTNALEDHCAGKDPEESPADRARDEVGEPPGPAGDWNLPEVTYG